MTEVNGIDLDLLLEDLAQTKRRLSVLEKTQDSLLVFVIEKLPSKEVLRLEKFFLNTFKDDEELPDDALTILNVIRSFSTASYHKETKQAVRDCFNAIPNLNSSACSDPIFKEVGIAGPKKSPKISASLGR